MKKSILAICCIGFLSALNADAEPFFSVEYSLGKLQYLNVADEDKDMDSQMYGFRLGAEEDEYRAYFSLGKMLEEDHTEASYLFLSIDRFIAETEDWFIDMAPYVGIHAGQVSYETTSATDKYDDSSMAYGAQAGLVFNRNEAVSFELLYQYSTVNSDYMNDLARATAAVNFKF